MDFNFVENDKGDGNEERIPHSKLPQFPGEKKSRAVTIQDLKNRLEAIHNKKNLTYKEKLQKKSLKNRMKKKSKQEERTAKQKIVRAEKLSQKQKAKEENGVTTEVKPSKPVFNSEGKMVFSKFDFSGLGKSKNKKKEKDPKIILQNLQKQKEKLEQLEAVGDKDKAAKIKEKSAWKNAIAKAQGEKVKDDPELLKKSVKKLDQKKKQSKKKWDQRLETVQKQKDERQKKRTENIEKRKKDKKNTKLKKAVKKGKIIPGF